MGIKLVAFYWGRNINWGCLRIKCWGRYLWLRGTGKQLTAGECIVWRLCEWTGDIWGSYVRCDVTAVWHCAAGGCLCATVPEYSTAITRTFAINSVIVVAISHTLSASYLNSNECSGSTSGWSGGILHKIRTFHWSHTSTKNANVVGISKLLRAPTWREM